MKCFISEVLKKLLVKCCLYPQTILGKYESDNLPSSLSILYSKSPNSLAGDLLFQLCHFLSFPVLFLKFVEAFKSPGDTTALLNLIQ